MTNRGGATADMGIIGKNKAFRIWIICAALIFAVTFVSSYALFYNAGFSSCLDDIFGGEKLVVTKGNPDDYIYYAPDYASKKDVLIAANSLNESICGEGTVLLKNEKSLPLENGDKISVFGKNSSDPVYGGTGTGAVTGAVPVTLYESLERNFKVNPVLKTFYGSPQSGAGRGDTQHSGTILSGMATGETPLSAYPNEVWDSCKSYSSAALIFISRAGGEGYDLPRTMKTSFSNEAEKIVGAVSADSHYLQLDNNEAELIKRVGSIFDNVIVLINSPNAMELGFLDDPAHYAYSPNVKGALWVGVTGNTGFNALADILTGETNPSGRLTDTYARDFKNDPTFCNFSNNNEENGNRYTLNGKNKPYFFTEYEEGIYVGYRYWETRAYTESLKGNARWYGENVVYPFGYGLSYTKFRRDLVSSSPVNGSTVAPDGKITVKIRIINVGDVAGKDVVQLYYSPPYKGGIEKPYIVLGDFCKTKLLEPGQEETVTLTLDVRDMSSYDYSDANGNGMCGYELESGLYSLYIGGNAHCYAENDVLKINLEAGKDFYYTTDSNTRNSNLFDEVSGYIKKYMSRKDFEGTFPKSPAKEEREKDEQFFESLRYVPQESGSGGATYNGVSRSDDGKDVKLYELIGKDYNDNLWESLLDRLNADDMRLLVGTGAYGSRYMGTIGKPATTDADGVAGFTKSLGSSAVYDTCFYAGSCVLGATFNKNLAFEFGKMIGNEALVGNEKGDGRPYNGWYAPAVNIHRSPFGGRNWEYFSEDGYLSGIMAANVINGAKEKGVYTFVKHFALNEQETNRSNNGLLVWANEQSMREIYFRAFEIAVKDGGTTAIMSSFNRIGKVWAGGSYSLLTELLRNEWGFEGMVITDYNYSTSYMNVDQMLFAGGDLSLSKHKLPEGEVTDEYLVALRRATANILYTVANSNAMNGIGEGVEYFYAPPAWHAYVYVADAVIGVSVVLWGTFVIVKALKIKSRRKTEC